MEIKKTLEKIKERNTKTSKKMFEKECPICKEKKDAYYITAYGACQECLIAKEATSKIKRYIPPKFREIETDREKLIEKYTGKSLFLTGGAGTGKTVFACSMLKKYYRMGQEGKFISYPAFIMELQSMFGKEYESPFDKAKEIARKKGILVIDDLGAQKLTDYVRQITYFIINEREQYNLPVVITSNFSLDDIDEQIDPRVSSRIVGMCEVLRFNGEDRRLKRSK